MIDLRFTGFMGTPSQKVDVRFRTDMINVTDENFNILQIQDGQEFTTSDKQSDDYQNFFAGTFKETNNSLGTAKQFAIDNGLDLRATLPDGTVSYLVNDASVSASV